VATPSKYTRYMYNDDPLRQPGPHILTYLLYCAYLTYLLTCVRSTVRAVRSTRGNTGTRAGPNGAIGRITYRLDPRIGPLHRERNRVARGGTQGGLNCLTHALPRCLPTPTEEADGNGYSVIAGRGGPSRPPPRGQALT
jgi:hypothetical protein